MTHTLISARQRAIERVRLVAVAETPTQELPAIQPVRPARRPAVTRPLVPIDEYGRPYILTHNVYEETSVLITQLVERYVSLQGGYPTVVLMSCFRYLTYGMKVEFYSPEPGVIIPLACEGHPTYEVMARGERG